MIWWSERFIILLPMIGKLFSICFDVAGKFDIRRFVSINIFFMIWLETNFRSWKKKRTMLATRALKVRNASKSYLNRGTLRETLTRSLFSVFLFLLAFPSCKYVSFYKEIIIKITRKVWLILILVHMGDVTQFTELNTVKKHGRGVPRCSFRHDFWRKLNCVLAQP